MNELAEPTSLVAAAAAVLALLALVVAVVAYARVRRLRAAQQVVLGASGKEDLIAHAASLQEAFAVLHERVEEIGAHLDQRMDAAEERLAGAIAYRALVRYDAYGELSGHQSTTIALLDAHRDGIVLSCIAHRDTARLYSKQIAAGEGEQQLSPEEAEAVRLAISGEVASRTLS